MTASPKILQLQKDLLFMGFNPGPLDGSLGSRVKGACYDAAESLKVANPKAIDDAYITFIHEARGKLPVPPVPYPNEYYDLSHLASQGWKRKDRTWANIDTIVLHQTGAPMGSDPDRWLGLRAHYGITRNGIIYRVRKETDFGWHAQGLSHKGIGIEISGFFLGDENDKKTRPGGPPEWAVNSITPEQVDAVKQLVRYLVALVAHHGGKIKYILPHRVATDDRTFDPGSLTWQLVAIPLLAELGLSDGGPGWIYPGSSGEPIPGCWVPGDAARANIPLIGSRKKKG